MFSASERKKRFTTKDGWRGGKSCLLYLDEIAGIWKRAKTSHIDCAVPKHGTAGVGLYERAACREVRFVLYRAIAMRGSDAHRRCRHRYHSRDRISAHPGLGCFARPGDRLSEPRAKPADSLAKAHRTRARHIAGQQFAQHASTDANYGRPTLGDRSRVF